MVPLFLVLTLLGGCFMRRDYSKKTMAEAELVAENYLKERYQNIKSVEIERVYRGPMGGMDLEGTVNQQYEFGMGMDESVMKVQSLSLSEGFPPEKEDYDLETREQAAAVAESYLRNNYEDIETIEIERISRRSVSEDMKLNGIVNTYGFVIILDESDLTVEEIGIYNSTEGLSAPYEKPERKAECLDADCDY